MKKLTGFFVITTVIMVSCQKDVGKNTDEQEIAAAANTGNGAPSGPHFNLNIIGVPKDKNPNFSGGEGRRIFVDLAGQTKILLKPGPFDVLDADGTDGTASFQLPEPDTNDDNIT